MAPGARLAKIRNRVSQWKKRCWDNSSVDATPGDTTSSSFPSFSAFSMLRPLSSVPSVTAAAAAAAATAGTGDHHTSSEKNATGQNTISTHQFDQPLVSVSSPSSATSAATVESSSARMSTRSSARASAESWSPSLTPNVPGLFTVPYLPPMTMDPGQPECAFDMSSSERPAPILSKRKRADPEVEVQAKHMALLPCNKQPSFEEALSQAMQAISANRALNLAAESATVGVQEMCALAWMCSRFSCKVCQNRIPLNAASMVRNVQSMMPMEKIGLIPETIFGTVHSGFRCPHCAAMNCPLCGCISPFGLPQGSVSTVKVPSVTWCCEMGRLVLVMALCCGVDCKVESPSPVPSPPAESPKHSFSLFKTKEPKEPKESKADAAQEPPSKKHLKVAAKKAFPRKHSKTAIPRGVGYGSMPNGLQASEQTSKSALAAYSLQTEDYKYEIYFRMLCRLIANPNRASGSAATSTNFIIIYNLLTRSPLMTKVAELLLNTSVEDVTKRFSLYEGLCDFLTALGDHEMTVRLVTQPREVYAEEEQVPHACFLPFPTASWLSASTDGSKGKLRQREVTDSLAVLLGRMAVQCQFVLQKATVHSTDYLSGDGVQMLSMCRHLVALSERFVPEAVAPAPASPGTARATTRNASIEADSKAQAEAATAWHREKCVQDVDDELVRVNHYYGSATSSTRHSIRGRMKKLVNDVNTLRSSLPEGIYVRHGATRLDVMKVLIIGPKETPYENGLFEFDLFCPGTWPQVPPLMRLLTTGGGQVRFNPNLYADGMVCLSLLGTWSHGQTWVPWHSTLLQVLVSIQAMIFCEEPYYNEPGREDKRNPQASARENANLQKQTVQHAMLNWLNQLSPYGPADPADPAGQSPPMLLWDEVVRKHFAVNAATIMQTVTRWGVKDETVRQLREALRKHSFLD